MGDLSRRRALSLGAALGLAGIGVAAADPAQAWSWSSKGSIAKADTVTDPFWVWDDATDPLVASLLDGGQIPAVNAAFGSWAANGDALPGGLPSELRTYLQQYNALPSWADRTKLNLAGQFNKRVYLFEAALYGLGSGVMSTVIPREARNVYYSAGGTDMKIRAAKTFTYGYDLSMVDAYLPTGHFIVTSNKTRLTHAAVRHLLPQSAAWEAVTDEQRPISNGDILRTFHSLGTFVHRKMLDWGIWMSPAEEDAYLHLWQVALHLLGVRDDFIPATWADADAQSAQILTPNLAPTPEGDNLAQTLLGYVEQPVLGVDTGFLDEFIRYVLSDTIGDWLSFPRDYISRALIDVAWPAFVAFEQGTSLILPEGYDLLTQFLNGLATLFLSNGTSATNLPITIPTGNRPGT